MISLQGYNQEIVYTLWFFMCLIKTVLIFQINDFFIAMMFFEKYIFKSPSFHVRK